jgi:hypothetical protein
MPLVLHESSGTELAEYSSEGQMRKAWALSVVALLLASTSWAVPVTFIHIADGGSFTGLLDDGTTETPFEVDDFTIRATGDTAARQTQAPGVFFIDHFSAQIEIPTVGSFTFLTPTRTFVNQGDNEVGFSRAGSSGDDLLNEVAFDAGVFASYDLLTSIGPVFGDGFIIQWLLSPVQVTDGTTVFQLVFDNGFPENASYQAIVEDGGQVSEPGTLGFLALGLVALRRASRRSRSRV